MLPHKILHLIVNSFGFYTISKKNYAKFSKNRRVQNLEATDKTVEILNCEIVKFAEDKIIANVEADWIKEMVKNYRDWRVEILNAKFLEEVNGIIFHQTERAVLNSKSSQV
jgi:hypothetical protein